MPFPRFYAAKAAALRVELTTSLSAPDREYLTWQEYRESLARDLESL